MILFTNHTNHLTYPPQIELLSTCFIIVFWLIKEIALNSDHSHPPHCHTFVDQNLIAFPASTFEMTKHWNNVGNVFKKFQSEKKQIEKKCGEFFAFDEKKFY